MAGHDPATMKHDVSPPHHHPARGFGPLLTLTALLGLNPGDAAAEQEAARPRAARSVHLGWIAPEGRAFYNELTVRESTAGSYFMACGWNTGYFGIQELSSPTNKVVIFSVWDPTRGDNPNAVPTEQRVEVLHSDPDVRIRRFGGEGTGGQCMWPYPWKVGETCRFLLRATVTGERTAYSAFFHLPEEKRWKHLATFRTRTGGSNLRGYYSFIEDFRRDYDSVQAVRRADFGKAWVLDMEGRWQALEQARFTASGASWESRENINAGLTDDRFFLETGGNDRDHPPLRGILKQPSAPTALPPDVDALAFARGYSIPLLDVAPQRERQVVVDREPGKYLGHPTTCLLEDGRTILCVYPQGHGRGPIIYKRSTDGGLTWSERLPTPASWATSKETPSIHRVVDAAGRKRLIVWSGLYPARLAVSEDDGESWSELEPAGDWGGIVVMGSVVRLRDKPGHYLAMFHDDGRFLASESAVQDPRVMTLLQTFSEDGGLTWSEPESIWSGSDVHLCEPGIVRSLDGNQLAALLRENRRQRNSHVVFSNDEGRTWSAPRELPAALTGDRHTGVYAPDGRLFISFRDTTLDSPTKGDWVAWVGTYDDIVAGREGQYRVRLMDNVHAWDCAYPGVEILPDDAIVTTTYGHWVQDEEPFIVSVRLKLEELDAMAQAGKTGVQEADHRNLLPPDPAQTTETN